MFLEKITYMAHVFKDALTPVSKENVYDSFELRPLTGQHGCWSPWIHFITSLREKTQEYGRNS